MEPFREKRDQTEYVGYVDSRTIREIFLVKLKWPLSFLDRRDQPEYVGSAILVDKCHWVSHRKFRIKQLNFNKNIKFSAEITPMIYHSNDK